MDNLIIVFIIIFLAMFNVLQFILHYKERKDLCNRIMCKNIGEYKQIDKAPAKETITPSEQWHKNWRAKKPKAGE